MTRFVNPYTFVPLAGEPARCAPAGHAAMENGRLSGIVEFTVTTRTPLLIGGYESRDASGELVPGVPRRRDGTVMIPGSGFLGVVRSLHEALTGSCLRVLDADRPPVHRHPANARETADLRLAMVTQVDGDGRAVAAAVCGQDEVVWVDQEVLPRDVGRVPATGDRLAVPWHKAVTDNGRRLIRPGDVEAGEVRWVAGLGQDRAGAGLLLVTDTSARAPGRAYFAVGRMSGDTPVYAVSPGAWRAYCDAVDGADDLRPAVLGDQPESALRAGPAEFADVRWPVREADDSPGPVVGRRLRARRYLRPGQPVWVRLTGGVVTEIRLSLLWRYLGGYPPGDRADGAVPCTDPASLCWSCRVFGSADVSGRSDDDISRQRSYRGHVRVDDLLAREKFEPVPWHLAPLSAPKPSAGQFYLDSTGRRQVAPRNSRPAATWGSVADEDSPGRPRSLRGRKFYWRTTDPERGDHPRGRFRHQADTLGKHVLLIPPGVSFAGRVCFENLGPADYGSLLAALDPRLLSGADSADWDGAVTSVGGGKPFGFGAVTVDITSARVQTAAGRYLGQPDAVPGPAAAVTVFREAARRPARAAWPALRHALTLGFVRDDLVWYPPGQGAKGDEEFDRSFEFFSRTNGLAFKDKVHDLVVLPPADKAAGDQVLDSAAGERPLPAEDRPRGGGGRS